MRRCLYHTDLGKTAIFHNFGIRIALIQYSGRSKHDWAFSVKSPIRPAGCYLWRVWMNINRFTLQHYKELSCFFLFSGLTTMFNLQKRLIRAAFWVLVQAMFMNDWKQTAPRLKLQERLLTTKKRNIIRGDVYREQFSRRQVFKLKA